jgi:exonuclease SbcC
MKIEKLRLKGFTGIKRGLGLDEIEIDFTQAAGLIALEGQNGCGKSTVLENLHPYNILASREGALYQHVCDRKAEKELCFSYQGRHYRTLLKIDSESGKSEGFIFNGSTKSEVKGKISEYAKYIKELLGSPELFFNSVFCAQGSKKLSDLRTGELKDLFAEFLRLDRLQGHEGTAKQAANIFSAKLSDIEIRIVGLQERVRGGDQLKMDIALQENHLRIETDKKSILQQGLNDFRAQVEALKETISKNAIALQRKADVQASIDRLQQDMATEKTAVVAEIEQLKVKYLELQTEIGKADATLKDKEAIEGAAEKEKEITDAIEKKTAMVEEAASGMEQNRDKVHALELEISKLKQDYPSIKADALLSGLSEKMRDNVRKTVEAMSGINGLDHDSDKLRLQQEIAFRKEKMATLDLKDPACQSKTCSFIVGALKALDELPELELNLQERIDYILERKAELENLKRELSKELMDLQIEHDDRQAFLDREQERVDKEITDKEKSLKAEKLAAFNLNETLITARQQVVDLRNQLAKVKLLSARVSEVQVAETRKADLQKQLAEVTDRGMKKRTAWEQREVAGNKILDSHAQTLTDLESEIDAAADEKIKTLNGQIQAIETVDLPNIEKEIQAAREKIAQLQGELSKMADAEKELADVQAEKEKVTREISEWTYLKNACGKNGLQALEIDGAAPAITGFANDLLGQAFGPLYSVKLLTQDPEGKECLDIMTINDDGSEILLDNLSGGQKIWNLMALRLGMTLLSKEKSGRNFETAFFDELDGPLDPENAVNFIQMYKAFMKVGGFKLLPFISHKPSCRSMADHILSFEPGKNPEWR